MEIFYCLHAILWFRTIRVNFFKLHTYFTFLNVFYFQTWFKDPQFIFCKKAKQLTYCVSNSFNKIEVIKKVKHSCNFTRYVYNSFVLIIDMKTLSDRKLVLYKRILFKEIPTVISLHPPVANLLVLFGDTLHIHTVSKCHFTFQQHFPKTSLAKSLKLQTVKLQFKLQFQEFLYRHFWEILLKCKIQFRHSVIHSFGWEFGHVMNFAMGTERIYIIKGIARVYSSPERVSCSGIGLMKRK